MTVPPLSVVGIGASAGGLDAFQRFFENMPPDSGMAFVVVLHLPASRRSMLPSILSRWTRMRVLEAGDGDLLEPDCVYVPPPHASAGLRDGRFVIRPADADRPRDARPIDGFFDSLAANLHEAAVGIVLSGTGTDGSLGLKAIRAVGGVTLAQGGDHSGPQFAGMPAGAIATGAVDLIASAEEMPAHLLRIMAARRAPEPTAKLAQEEIERARLAICGLVRAQLGHDFSGYKQPTFLRRVQRRMQLLNIADLHDYVRRLEVDQKEVVLLFRDLLIRVTSFFRDPETFELLQRAALPRLFAGKTAEHAVRVWVPGCATGEEAYSLAMLLREYADEMRTPSMVQVFATDIDERAISTARAGRYPATLLDGMAPDRLTRFFSRTESGYTVAKEIRELCTFSTHSLVRDPPFSRMNLISCRNLLIYLDTALQATVIPAFHYSLAPGGILVLGSSETISRHDNLFEQLDATSRIFLRRDVGTPPLRLFPAVSRGNGPRGRDAPQASRFGAADPSGADGSGNGGDGATGNGGDYPSPAAAAPVWGRGGAALRGLRERLFPGGRVLNGLRQQLQQTQHRLQAVTEDHETALEELRSANEELHSVNEEMQSTNEELETSREELQSVNEELHTVNAQLSDKLEELDRSNSDLRNLFESTDVATIFLDRNLIIRGFTPAVGTIYNLIPSDLGRPLTDIVNRLHYQDVRRDVRRVLETLEPLERRVAHQDGRTHFILRILPYRGSDSEVNGTLVTFLDVSSIVHAEQHQRLLIDELNHRVKNMLTVVISLARQTLRRATSVEEFADVFMGRIEALTASYTLLSQQKWENVSLQDILQEETKPFQSAEGRRFQFSGADVKLAPHAALSLGMAIHELATNAVKHGALSSPSGMVEIAWRVNDAPEAGEFLLTWRESGGPPVTPPVRHGFGMSMIERGFAHELSGSVALAFEPTGLAVTLKAPATVALALASPQTMAAEPER